MKSNDLTPRSRAAIREAMHQALRDNNTEAYYEAFDEMMERVSEDIRNEYNTSLDSLRQEMDSRVLAYRGVNQLTSREREFYQKFGDCIKAADPKQALNDANLVLPISIIDRVFENLKTEHPLLSAINFVPSSGATKIITSANGYQRAVWGELCADIVKEVMTGFILVDTNLFKLSAFLPVCKAMLDLGPEWIDRFVRQVLYEAWANGAEYGFVSGSGASEPVGMIRNVGAGVAVVDGKYPAKDPVTVSALDAATLGRLISLLAVDSNGKPRQVNDLFLLVNPQDYFLRVMPATTVMAPDGTYRNNVLPYPMSIIQTAALEPGKAVLGIPRRYLGLLGTEKNGRIEYSDHYQFLEDRRVYLVKGYANGLPLDNNSFLYLDISGLQPMAYKVELINKAAPSAQASLSDLRIGSLTLSPEYSEDTAAYTASTTNATNTITAVPADAGAAVQILVNEKEIANGSAANWTAGENTVKINVTAADGTTSKVYTVTVTKD